MLIRSHFDLFFFLTEPMASTSGTCGCCSRRALVILFALCGVILLTAGLVFSVGGVFSRLVKEKVDEVSYKNPLK